MIFRNKLTARVIFWGICICIFLLPGYGVYQLSCRTFHQKRAGINGAFQSAVHRDRELRYEQAGNPSYFVGPSFSVSDTSVITIQSKDAAITIPKDRSSEALTHDERRHLAVQCYLHQKNPLNVSVLDSLFREELSRRALPVQTAVVCTIKDSVCRSHADTAFYASAIATDEIPVMLAEMTLQAYVHVPLGYWLKENRLVYFSALMCWLSCGGLLAGWRIYAEKRKKRAVVPLETVEGKPLLEIAPGVCFDEIRGILTNEQTMVELHGETQLELFRSLLNAPNQFMSYAEMKRDLWRNGDISSNTIQKAIRRLNHRLSSLPLSVSIISGKGCRLNLPEQVSWNGIASSTHTR
jgi:hypothetical protein